jgi:hypothetical protein
MVISGFRCFTLYQERQSVLAVAEELNPGG